MRELHDKGYVKYEPSFNPFRGSMVHLFNFSEDLKPVQKKASTNQKILPVDGQLVNKHQTSNKPTTEQALVSYINSTNNPNTSNGSNLGEQTQNFNNKIKVPEEESASPRSAADQIQLKNSSKKEVPFTLADSDEKQTAENWQKSSAKKESRQITPPTFDEVINYFARQAYPEIEAQKFYNYFASNGWLVGGKTPMVDWTAAAHNWILNADKFNAPEQPAHRAKNLNTTTNKDYSEPL